MLYPGYNFTLFYLKIFFLFCVFEYCTSIYVCMSICMYIFVYMYMYVCALYVCNALGGQSGHQILWPGVTVVRYHVDAGN